MESYRARSVASFREVAAAQAVRETFKEKLAEFFAQGWDGILMPLGAVPAFTHRHDGVLTDRRIEVDNQSVSYLHLLDWITLATALHAPALAVPAGQTPAGLPVGVQLVGPWNGEDRLFDFGAAIEDGLGGFTPPKL
jgi:amidase